MSFVTAKFHEYRNCCTCNWTLTPKLCQFTPMAEYEVKTIIMSMMSKSCEIDPIPTHIFKQLLPSVIPIITK